MKCDGDTEWTETYSQPFLQRLLKQSSQPAKHYYIPCLEETWIPNLLNIIS